MNIADHDDDALEDLKAAHRRCKQERDDLLAAAKTQHEAIDRLFAMLIERSPPDKIFMPSESGQPWAAGLAGNAAIKAAEGR